MTKFFGILLARQRSGTGALGTVLDKHQELEYTGEVFHPSNIGTRKNYFTYKRSEIEADIKNFVPSKNIDQFLNFLEQIKSENKCPIVDIKYNSLHHLNGDWHAPVDRPLILNYCISNQLPIVHLTRKNYLAGHISGLLAAANKVWHARKNDEISVLDIEVDVSNLVESFQTIQRNVDLVKHWLGRRHFVTELEYDEIFDSEGGLTEQACESIQDIFDVGQFLDRFPVFVKQNKVPLHESIKNFDEVCEALFSTEFAWMVEI